MRNNYLLDRMQARYFRELQMDTKTIVERYRTLPPSMRVKIAALIYLHKAMIDKIPEINQELLKI